MPLPYDPTRRSGSNRQFSPWYGGPPPDQRQGSKRGRTTSPYSFPHPQAQPQAMQTIPQRQWPTEYTAPRNSEPHPFYDPQATYANPGVPRHRLTPGSSEYNMWGTEESPEGYYYGILAQKGLGGTDSRSLAAQGMYGDISRGYQAARAHSNTNLFFPEFVEMQNIPRLVAQMSDEALGFDRARYQNQYNWTLRG